MGALERSYDLLHKTAHMVDVHALLVERSVRPRRLCVVGHQTSVRSELTS
jgi:hypothetical protein